MFALYNMSEIQYRYCICKRHILLVCFYLHGEVSVIRLISIKQFLKCLPTRPPAVGWGLRSQGTQAQFCFETVGEGVKIWNWVQFL